MRAPGLCQAPEGCNRPAIALELCSAHYMRRRRGSKSVQPVNGTAKPGRQVQTLLDRKLAVAFLRQARREKLSAAAAVREAIGLWVLSVPPRKVRP